jgi:hypothetical protein
MQKILLLLFNCLFIQVIQAQKNADIEIRLSSDTIMLGNYFSVQIQLWSQQDASFILPVTDKAEVMLVSNSKSESPDQGREEWIFKVQPYYEGVYYIPKMNIKVNNEFKINIDAIQYTVIPNENENQESHCETQSPLIIKEFEYSEIKKGLFNKRSKSKADED